MFGCMFGVIVFGFFGYLRLFLGSFMDFGVGFMSVRVLQGVLRVFGVSQGVSLGV